VARALRKHEEPGWRTWGTFPSELDIRDRIEAFFQAIHGNRVEDAFTLCPLATERGLVGADEVDDVDRALDAMRDVLAYDGYVDDEDPRWYRHVTPPSGAEYENVDLIVPDGDGDVLANVFVDDQVSDITAVFALMGTGDRWTLAFRRLQIL
jgi:hypothetical protein